ncbi:MAG: ribosome maturation factor RimM [Gammaproteobacteria bacterium]|jgi:16S rRNA processing protein RimM|nr:ribosome maturation factor RimM [Gammaproteobacteria bacterium]
MMGQRLVTVARLGAPYGVRGWLKVHSFTSPPESVLDYDPWRVRVGGEWKEFRVAEGRVHGKGVVARLEGFDDREAVRTLVGAEVAVERSRLGDPGAGSYFWADLIGAEVVNREGEPLGRVDHLIDNGQQDVLVIRGGDRERLIPFVQDHYILEVDVEAGRIVVDWGLDY